MRLHDWTAVPVDEFPEFHSSWITHLKDALNRGVLPSQYGAVAERPTTGLGVADISTFHEVGKLVEESEGGLLVETHPPAVAEIAEPSDFVARQKRIAIRHAATKELVAIIEIVSPGNKSSVKRREQFVDKVVTALDQGIHVVVLDVTGPNAGCPNGLHYDIFQTFESEATVDESRPLLFVSYASDPGDGGFGVRSYLDRCAANDPLPQTPLFLQPDRYVTLPLQETYERTIGGLPSFIRDRLH